MQKAFLRLSNFSNKYMENTNDNRVTKKILNGAKPKLPRQPKIKAIRKLYFKELIFFSLSISSWY